MAQQPHLFRAVPAQHRRLPWRDGHRHAARAGPLFPGHPPAAQRQSLQGSCRQPPAAAAAAHRPGPAGALAPGLGRRRAAGLGGCPGPACLRRDSAWRARAVHLRQCSGAPDPRPQRRSHADPPWPARRGGGRRYPPAARHLQGRRADRGHGRTRRGGRSSPRAATLRRQALHRDRHAAGARPRLPLAATAGDDADRHRSGLRPSARPAGSEGAVRLYARGGAPGEPARIGPVAARCRQGARYRLRDGANASARARAKTETTSQIDLVRTVLLAMSPLRVSTR